MTSQVHPKRYQKSQIAPKLNEENSRRAGQLDSSEQDLNAPSGSRKRRADQPGSSGRDLNVPSGSRTRQADQLGLDYTSIEKPAERAEEKVPLVNTDPISVGFGRAWDEQAKTIAHQLYNINDMAQIYTEVPADFQVDDLAYGVLRFKFELELASKADNKVVSIILENEKTIPVDSRGVLSRNLALDDLLLLFDGMSSPAKRIQDTVEKILEKMGFQTKREPHATAEENFMHHFTNFILSRLKGKQERTEEDSERESLDRRLLYIEVFTPSPGFIVKYSPVYLYDPQNPYYPALGTPSTPAQGYIRPGVYIFGVQNQSTEKWATTTSFEVPPCTKIHLEPIL